ncbi:hypothetical protein A7976_02620 [Methylobacillus sp. MM3]|uniref:hypothetical protein n=1 Tax=Methylobacillus sp. MM3 TaxID=1848039 RepID=UPI0007E290B4|nr:hypothetical protein [Methylobacillus sp. MM3]OAJ70511.1 hypothetical protein A7976_02620 [Methylobacillus sp. MM3]
MNQLPTDPLDLTILLFKNMQNYQITAGQLSGKVSDGIDFETLRATLDHADLLISANSSDSTLECHVATGFFETLDDVLASPARRITAPLRFYLADSDSLYSGDEMTLPSTGQHYLAATKLYALFAKEADHQGGVGEAKTLVFLHREKIEITPHYTVVDLHELPALKKFESEFVTSETHKEQKRTILKTALLELFLGRKKLPFSELLSRFEEFVEKVQASYQLYVAEFSFQKVKAEVEKEKLDAMIKLNKVFSDMQSQLLAVPVALVLVGGQMENKGAWTSKNLLIWLGALIFAILMDLLIRNQRHTLKAVKNEVDQQQQQLESKYQTVVSRFQHVYKEIDARHAHQKWLIWVIDGLVALCLAISTIVMLYFSGVSSFFSENGWVIVQ